jgi:hypothetical protein
MTVLVRASSISPDPTNQDSDLEPRMTVLARGKSNLPDN